MNLSAAVQYSIIWCNVSFFFSSEPLHKRGFKKLHLHALDFFSPFLVASYPFCDWRWRRASSLEICNLIFFGWHRRLFRSFVRRAIKNQALRERICQRPVLFEAHRSLNVKKFDVMAFFFSFSFSPDVGRIEIFSALLLSRPGRGT